MNITQFIVQEGNDCQVKANEVVYSIIGDVKSGLIISCAVIIIAIIAILLLEWYKVAKMGKMYQPDLMFKLAGNIDFIKTLLLLLIFIMATRIMQYALWASI